MRPLRLIATACALTALPFLAGCAGAPVAQLSGCGQAPAPQISYSPDGRTAHLRLDVLTYNIEGLSWPAKRHRKAELAEIGQRLSALRAAGEAPDIVVFQERFSGAAERAIQAAGYPDLVAGPSPFHHRDLPADGQTPGPRSWRKGELGFHLTGGGLAIASRFPILAHKAEPFSRKSCAGLDCLANKGALYAAVEIPGVPDPVQVFDSHMNARHASRAPLFRTLAAHKVEAEELADFIAHKADPAYPTLLAGDFNMRHSQARFETFTKTEPLMVVQRWCRDVGPACDLETHATAQTPWLETEDLQLFRPGRRVDVRPLRVDTLFDGGAGGPRLSDHDALRVTYDLSWPAGAVGGDGTCRVASGAAIRATQEAQNLAGPQAAAN